MNFNLKKCLMLSIAGLAMCNMQSDASSSSWHSRGNSPYRYQQRNANLYSGLRNVQNTATYIPAKIVIKNKLTNMNDNDSLVNLEAIQDLSNVDEIVDSVLKAFSTPSVGVNSVLLGALNLKQGKVNDVANIINDMLSDTIDELTNKYSISSQAVQNVLALTSLISYFQQYYEKSQPEVGVPLIKQSNSYFDDIWNMLCHNNCVNLYTDMVNKLAAMDDISDDCLGAMLEYIFNNQVIKISNESAVAFTNLFASLFNKDEPFLITANNRVHCLVSSFEPYQENGTSFAVLQKFNAQQDFSKTNEVLNNIGFKGKLNVDGMQCVQSYLAKCGDLSKVNLGEDSNIVRTASDLLIYLSAPKQNTGTGGDSNPNPEKPVDPVQPPTETGNDEYIEAECFKKPNTPCTLPEGLKVKNMEASDTVPSGVNAIPADKFVSAWAKAKAGDTLVLNLTGLQPNERRRQKFVNALMMDPIVVRDKECKFTKAWMEVASGRDASVLKNYLIFRIV